MRRLIFSLLAVLVVLGSAMPFAHAEEAAAPDDAIKYRQWVMCSVSQHTQAFFALFQGKNPNVADKNAAMADHAEAIAIGARLAQEAFKQDTRGEGTAPTTAKEEVFANAAKFQEDLKKLETLATDVALHAREDNTMRLGMNALAMGQHCQGCHKEFSDGKSDCP